jgi:hypothetical protein
MQCLPLGGELPGGGGQLPPSPQLPGMVTESDCHYRTEAARSAGAADEQQRVIKYSIIGAVVSGVVGYGLARVLG